MKQGVTVVVLAAALVAAGAAWAEDPEDTAPAEHQEATSSSDGMTGNVQFLMGQTYLSDFWKPIDEPASFGIEIDFGPSKSIVHVAMAWSGSLDSGTVTTPYFGRTGHVAVGLLEFSAGFLVHPVRKGPVRPYIGAGALRVFASTDSGANAWNGGDSDSSFGFYGNVGVFFKVGDHFNIGFDGRIVRGTKILIVGVEGDADYEQINMLIGFSWGK
jgi:opacity protein-like surface antigen